MSAGVPTVPDPAAGAATAPVPPEPHDSFEATLDEAKQRYFRGETQAAKELLQQLQLRLYAGEKVDRSLEADVLIYLGEIYYLEGNHTQAEVLFRYLLEQDPDTPISAFHHSAEVVELFELVRKTVIKDRLVPDPQPQPRPPPTPAPVWVFCPLGIPQFGQHRPAAGLVYGALQIGLGTASLVYRYRLGLGNTDVQPNPLHWEKPTVIDHVEREKYLYQWPATFGFYLAWGMSSVDAIRYHQRHPVAATISTTPTGTPTLGITGQL